MKKILFLLLLSVTMYGQVPADATPLENIQITNNIQDTISDRVSVSTSDGVLNWKYAKDLIIPAKAFLSTGLIKNGLISANGDLTKFNITAGIGIISNFDDPENPISTIINFPAFNSITPAYLTTGNITYVAINSTPAVVMQATPFTPEQRRSLIVLGATIHSNLTTINVLNNISAPTNADTNQLHDFMEAVGALNITGNKYTANGANLQLNKSAGVLFKLGSNFAVDWRNPHEIAQSGGTTITFRYRTQNGTESADMTSISPGLYDLNNVLTTVPNNKFTIQTVTVFQTGLTRIQWGQTIYDDLQSAKNALLTRDFAVENNIKENGVTRAYIIVRNSTTSLQNVSDAYISEAQKFGGVASGGVALTLANIVTALGYTPENEANKQNSLAVDGTGIKYPTVDATNAGLATKQNTLTNPITGTGTTNYLPKWTGTTTQGNSTISDNGSIIDTNSKVRIRAGTVNMAGYEILAGTSSETGFSYIGLKGSRTDIYFGQVGAGTALGVTGSQAFLANGSAPFTIGTQNAQPVVFGSNNLAAFRVHVDGKTSFGTNSNNGIDIVQFNGTISATPATLSNQAVVKSQLDLKADLASPTFTGVPSVPTATAGTNTTQIASTAFVLANTNFSNDISVNGVNVGRGAGGSVENTRVGNDALSSNLTGMAITSVGTQSLLNSTTSNNGNSSFGTYNLINIITGGANTSLGMNGGRSYGLSGLNLTSLSSSVLIGSDTRPLDNGDTNEIVIGSQAIGAGSNTATLGNTSITKTVLRGVIHQTGYTVATLPTGSQGMFAYVTDALAPSYMVAVVGGGAVVTPVFYDGTVWRSTINSDSVSLTGNQTIGGIKTFTDSVNIIDDFEPTINFTNNSFSGYLRLNSDSFELSKKVYSPSFIKTGGTASQFLKADGSIDESDVVKNIVKDATQGANITGTVSETILYSKLIPANTFKDGDFMNIVLSRIGKVGVAGTLNQRIRINTSNTLAASLVIATNFGANTILMANMSRIFNITNGNLISVRNNADFSTDIIDSTLEPQTTVFNPVIDNYIFVTGTLSNSADTMYHLGTKITN